MSVEKKLFFVKLIRNVIRFIINLSIVASVTMLFWVVYTGFKEGNFSQILTTYLVTIGILIALASATFSYAKISDDSGLILFKECGELFLYAAIAMILALLISSVSFEIGKLFSANRVISYFTFVFAAFGNSFLLFAGESIHVALSRMEAFLHSQTVDVRERMKMW